MSVILTTVKTPSQLLGTGGSAATIAHGGTPVNSTSLAMTSDFGAKLWCRVTMPASPGTGAVTVQFQDSPDGTNFFNDGGPYVVPLTASTSFDYPYTADAAAQAARVVVTNADGAVNVTALAYGSSIDTIDS